MTKYAVMVTDPHSIRYHLEKALYLATHGRLGPVWLDIPINVQAAQINEERLEGFDPSTDFDVEHVREVSMEAIQVALEKLNAAKRPVVFVGGGVRASGAYKEFRALMDALKIPVVTAWNAHDVLPEEFPYYAGRPGTVGDRPGNFVTQKADVLLILGSRCNIRQISYNWENFAKNAYKIMVDIDAAEMQKPTLKIDLQIHGDLKDFLPKMLAAVKHTSMTSHQEWIDWCLACRQKYPIVLPEYWERKEKVNPYCFMELLSEKLPENQIIVTGNGSACVTSFQAMKLKEGQRLYTNSGCAAMGYGFPAAIGACVASGNEKVICLDGDGSFQLNIQELAQVDYHKYPIKIFVLNNKGYLSIRQTQSGFFGEPLFGIDDETGLGFPDLEILAKAYHLKFVRCDNHSNMSQQLDAVLAGNEPVLCEVMLTPEQFFAPKLSSRRLPDGSMISSSLEDMAPFLPEEEVQANMFTEDDKLREDGNYL